MSETQQRVNECKELLDTGGVDNELPGPRWERDGLLVSALDGVAAVTGVDGRVEDGALHSDVHPLPLLWQLPTHRTQV